jgi:hypothetical protein
MPTMSEPTFEKGLNIRTTPKAQRALKRVVASLKGSERARWCGKDVTQEAVINASWLWMQDLDEHALEEVMARYLPRLEAIMRGEDPGPASDHPIAAVLGHSVMPQSEPEPSTLPKPTRRNRASGA